MLSNSRCRLETLLQMSMTWEEKGGGVVNLDPETFDCQRRACSWSLASFRGHRLRRQDATSDERASSNMCHTTHDTPWMFAKTLPG
jgi:hypothetical protein